VRDVAAWTHGGRRGRRALRKPESTRGLRKQERTGRDGTGRDGTGPDGMGQDGTGPGRDRAGPGRAGLGGRTPSQQIDNK
jgi:hypothetical protein